ncbi:hypothetical protein Sm713_06220 [Streptomyces sp. TS71-3]|nr:hypothetical protein Sm713_06220 [Streptomyces sp. TS71-3]
MGESRAHEDPPDTTWPARSPVLSEGRSSSPDTTDSTDTTDPTEGGPGRIPWAALSRENAGRCGGRGMNARRRRPGGGRGDGRPFGARGAGSGILEGAETQRERPQT